jgi:soluble lytic murein transglycosylase-like protein
MNANQTRSRQTLVWLLVVALTLSLGIDTLAQTRKVTKRRASPQSRFSPQLAEQIIRIAREEGLDPLLTLEVMRVESGFNRLALSPKRAMGLMQMIPATALRFGVLDPYDPAQAIRGGCRYLKFLSERYGGRLELVIAGYNAGEGAIDKYGKRVPPYKETREYVASVLTGYRRAKEIEATVLKEERSRYLQTTYISSRKGYQHSKQVSFSENPKRSYLEMLARIPKLGRISNTEVRR